MTSKQKRNRSIFLAMRERFANWLLKDVHIKEGKFGEKSVSLGDFITFSGTSSPLTAAGQMGMNQTSGRPLAFIDSAERELLYQTETNVQSRLFLQWNINGGIVVTSDADLAPPDGVRPVAVAGTIVDVRMWRGEAGAGGTTRLDVLLNGTSIYAADANKPQVTQAAGDNQINVANTISTTAVSAGDNLRMEVETDETGSPENVSLVVIIEPS